MFKNQNLIYDAILEKLKPLSSDKFITVSGKTGTGKSFLAKEITAEVRTRFKCPICYINGDQFCQDRDYYCIKQALTNYALQFDKDNRQKDLIIHSVSTVPKVGPVLERVLTDKMKGESQGQKSLNYFLDNEDEMDIVFRLSYLFDKQYGLIICDNIQYFDKKSLELLYLLVHSDVEYFDFLRYCQFLFVYTTEVSKLDVLTKNIVNHEAVKLYNLKDIEYSDMDEILDSMGLQKSLDNEIKKLLLNLTDGHLEIIKQIVNQMNNNCFELNLDIKNADSLLENLIIEKFKNMGANGGQISQILEYAALIGTAFSNFELEQIADLNKQDFINIIKKSNELNLIKYEQKFSTFSHDIIRLLFRNRAKNNIIYYSERMRKCLKELYPSEYKRRISIEINLGDFKQASILIVLLLIKQYNCDLEKLDGEYEKVLSIFPDFLDYISEMKGALNNYNQRQYTEVIKNLKRIDDFFPTELLVERDILNSISMTKILDVSLREEAVSCLESYTLEDLNGEGDLYLRFKLAMISSYSHNNMLLKAKACEREIIQYLQHRLSYDDSANETIHILRRKANSIHECQFAEAHIKRSVKYFAPMEGKRSPLNPIQYLMSLVNHSGILIECGRFDEALEEITLAQDLVQGNPMIMFPRTQILDNNFLIAAFLSDKYDKSKVSIKYRALLDLSNNADNILIASNYYAMIAANGQVDEAYDFFYNSYAQIRGLESSEQFYELGNGTNLLILLLYKQDYEQGLQLLLSLEKQIEGIIDESYYKQKFFLLKRVIHEQIQIPLVSIDHFLFDLCPKYQEAWAYWGKSFDYTALYYWSDL